MKYMDLNLKIIYGSLFLLGVLKQVCPTDKNYYKLSINQTFDTISDIPSQRDLPIYLTSLTKLVQFIAENKKCVNFGVKYGMFLLNVNLKPYVNEHVLPAAVRSNLTRLLKLSEKVQAVYNARHQKLKIHQAKYYHLTKMYVSLLSDDTAWSSKLEKLNFDLLKEIYKHTYTFPDWDTYIVDLENILKWMPNPEIYNKCLAYLSRNEENSGESLQCQVNKDCTEFFELGSYFGFVLNSKLLFIILARLSRGCIFFNTQEEDQFVRHRLCKSAFRESEYIATNGFKKLDILLEQITLCTLEGHAQFLRKSWLSNLLEHQTPDGFINYTVSTLNQKGLMQENIKNGMPNDGKDHVCRQHTNSLAVGTLAAVVRFLLETYH